MSESNAAPRLAVIVANGITGDSRVQKVAIAAARDGWDVTLIGRSLSKQQEESAMGPIKVLRLLVPDTYRKYRQRQERGWRSRLTQAYLPDRAALKRYRAAHNAWLLCQENRLTAATGAGAFLNPARQAWVRTRHDLFRFRNRLWGWEQSRPRDEDRVVGDWRRDLPEQVDRDLAFVAALEELKPDVIHANDITMISTAAQAVTRLRRRGHQVQWLYDAHEYVQGTEWVRPRPAHAYPAMEQEFIRQADAVVTVSPQIAELLRAEYDLPQTPLVVRNVPIKEVIGTDRDALSVRQVAEVDPETPLLVYVGWISAERGLRTAVSALVELPEFHLAIVANSTNAELKALLSLGVELGVSERLHVVPYVAQHLVADYLSSADLGIICSRHNPNYENSLPTKMSEYLHAGLPVVASDLRVVREFVESHDLGVVFTADDVTSFADAVRRAFGRRAAMAARIGDDLLRELSWEQQSAGLVQLYRDVAHRTPGITRPDVPWTVEEGAGSAGAPTEQSSRTWRPLSDGGIRLGIGPANFSGQAAGFARAICQLKPDVSVEVFMQRGPQSRTYPADQYLDVTSLGRADVQVRQVRRISRRYTHLIAEAFKPVFGYLNGNNIGTDLPMLAAAGIKVALLAHGTEIRHPGRHLARHPSSHFRDAPDSEITRLTALTERNRQVAEDSGLPVYVTTPDLLDDLPRATWAPLVIDVDSWWCDRPVMERARPVVLHAPSARWTKGTDHVMPVLDDLDRRGAIELRLAEKLTWAEMRDQIQNADLVIDQFTTGAYGALSCEAMAAGRPVVAYLGERVKAVVGPELPIIDATPETLAEAMQQLLDDRGRAAKIGLASREFAVKYHSGERTAQVLSDFLA
ncbi:glycosyltransferase [Krasilnikovia sp. MM14-A1004]|uniref:glycosyltransferase n=1 Tax=Krasilnikovia sp. MM14-A1004 TaxID=3373541 RepID=UPI00399CD95A